MTASTVALPKIKKMFIPDPGYTFYDIDLDQADAQVVAWTSEDEALKEIFRDKNRDLHTENAITLFGHCDTFEERQAAKVGVHGTNYGANAYALSIALSKELNRSFSVEEAQRFIDIWFEAHPAIPEWHERVQDELNFNRTITNAFGASITFFDRMQDIFKAALAWEPQSTVGIVINKGILNVHNNMPEVMPLLQVHDSSAGQYPTELESDEFLLKLKSQFEIVIPFDDPLIIGTGLKTSTKSWGDCKDHPWPTA